VTTEVLRSVLKQSQNEILQRLSRPFDLFFDSPQYRAWQQLQIAVEMKRAKKSSAAAAIPPTFFGKFHHVLIVDGCITTLKLISKTLECNGYQVDCASDGSVALCMLQHKNYEVVLIDLDMPIMDGFESVRRFREQEQMKRIITDEEEDNMSDISSSSIYFASQLPNALHQQGEEEIMMRLIPQSAEELRPVESSIKGGKSPLKNNSSQLRQANAGSGMDSVPTLTEHNLNMIDHEHFHRDRQLIIGTSSYVDEATKQRALQAGMDYFLGKPFHLEMFVTLVNQHGEDMLVGL
jgi:CheY-like chemotaxis protein